MYFQEAEEACLGHLLGHPYVGDVAVIPLPDDYSGEIPMAYVVPSADIAVRVKDPKEAEKVKAEIIKVSVLSVLGELRSKLFIVRRGQQGEVQVAGRRR